MRQGTLADKQFMAQVREFQPKMVAIRDSSKVAELKEAIKDVPRQPEILVGDEGAIEVARHAEVDAVVTGIVGARRTQKPSLVAMLHSACSWRSRQPYV